MNYFILKTKVLSFPNSNENEQRGEKKKLCSIWYGLESF
jgi:hypothetical protein